MWVSLKTKREEGKESENKSVFRVLSGSNERPLNSKSLIMSVLIIKRELLETKQLTSHYQISLQEDGAVTVYFHSTSTKHVYLCYDYLTDRTIYIQVYTRRRQQCCVSGLLCVSPGLSAGH